MYKQTIKALLDKLGAFCGILITLPFMCIIATAVYLQHGNPVIFSQKRPGKDGIPFTLYKFRTMYASSSPTGILLPDERRISKIGGFLRNTSLDELPQLFNVLKGDMSLVGPRPLLLEYLPLYSEKQKTRHNIRPGITGWAQVNKAKALQWKDKFDMDVWYVKNVSFFLDVRILLLTIINILYSKNIQDVSVTKGKFKGN